MAGPHRDIGTGDIHGRDSFQPLLVRIIEKAHGELPVRYDHRNLDRHDIIGKNAAVIHGDHRCGRRNIVKGGRRDRRRGYLYGHISGIGVRRYRDRQTMQRIAGFVQAHNTKSA